MAKIVSADILHKTDVGGVKVGLRSEDEVKKGNKVIVSEYTAPKDWVCIWS